MKQYIVEFESDYNRGQKCYIRFETNNPPLYYYRAKVMRDDHSFIRIFEIRECQ